MKPAIVLIATADAMLGKTLERAYSRAGAAPDLIDLTGLALAFRTTKPDLVIVESPQVDATLIVRKVSQVALIHLVEDHIPTAQVCLLLRTGADDVLRAPFSTSELLARSEAVIRRSHALTDALPPYENDYLTINFELHEVKLKSDGSDVPLTRSGWKMLHVLAATLNRPVSQTKLAWQLNSQRTRDPNLAVKAIISDLRDRIEPDPKNPRYLVTQTGKGTYMLVEENYANQTEPEEPTAADGTPA